MEATTYEKQNITVDIAIMTSIDDSIENLKVLLIKRMNDPFKDCWALPGGYLDRGETLLQAAYRELQEETSLTQKDLSVIIRQFRAYGDPGRDPRSRIVSVVHYAVLLYSDKLIKAVKANDDAIEIMWASLKNPPQGLAFDHGQILKDLFFSVVGGAI